jgi:hypothetical protein
VRELLVLWTSSKARDLEEFWRLVAYVAVPLLVLEYAGAPIWVAMIAGVVLYLYLRTPTEPAATWTTRFRFNADTTLT